jgi:hypothetical protein
MPAAGFSPIPSWDDLPPQVDPFVEGEQFDSHPSHCY